MNPEEINPGSQPTKGQNNSASVAINALSRVLAVLVLGAAVAGLGSLLDSWLGTNYWMLVGVILGMLLAIPGLFLVARVSELDAKRMASGGQDQTSKSLGDPEDHRASSIP